jgi:hypothetical protein
MLMRMIRSDGIRGGHDEVVTIPPEGTKPEKLQESGCRLRALFAGQAAEFSGWIRNRNGKPRHSFELAVQEADLETVIQFAKLCVKKRPGKSFGSWA